MSPLREAFKKVMMPAVLAMPLLIGTGAALAQEGPASNLGPQNTTVVEASAQSVSTFGFGGLTFAAPWVLLGLAGLPLLWRMLKSMPQKPREELLPSMRFLKDIEIESKHPDNMPVWQKALMVSLIGAALIAMAGPQFDHLDQAPGQGPIALVVDNDWTSASDWSGARREMNYIIDQAENDGRELFILSTTPNENDAPLEFLGPMSAEEAREALAGIQPQPWSVDREEALSLIEAAEALDDSGNMHVNWLTNGLSDPFVAEFMEELGELGSLTVIENSRDITSYLIRPPAINGNVFSVTVDRIDTDGPENIVLTVTDQGGNTLSQAELNFENGAQTGEALFEMSPEERSQIAQISIDGENTAGAVVMMDERYRTRPVGLLRDMQSGASVQALLDEGNYVEQAIDPYSNLSQGNLDELLTSPLSIIIWTDGIQLTSAEEARLQQWVEQGGTLLRFAGPHMAAEGGDRDDLLPVEIREDSRNPASSPIDFIPPSIAPFEEGSPFFGIEQDENVNIRQQITAQPGVETEQYTWASLTDGTPFVTGAPQGQGLVVLVHTTADTNWSDLPLSQLFIDMMRSVVAQSRGIAGNQINLQESLTPISLLDGFGQLSSPTSANEQLSPADINDGTIDPRTPPGLYGDGASRYAHNLASSIEELEDLDVPIGVSSRNFKSDANQTDIKPYLLAAAFLLALGEALAMLKQQGMLNTPSFRRKDKDGPQLPTANKGGPKVG